MRAAIPLNRLLDTVSKHDAVCKMTFTSICFQVFQTTQSSWWAFLLITTLLHSKTNCGKQTKKPVENYCHYSKGKVVLFLFSHVSLTQRRTWVCFPHNRVTQGVSEVETLPELFSCLGPSVETLFHAMSCLTAPLTFDWHTLTSLLTSQWLNQNPTSRPRWPVNQSHWSRPSRRINK